MRMENLNEMAAFLERNTRTKLMQEDIGNLDQPIRTKYMEMMAKDPPAQNPPAHALLWVQFIEFSRKS